MDYKNITYRQSFWELWLFSRAVYKLLGRLSYLILCLMLVYCHMIIINVQEKGMKRLKNSNFAFEKQCNAFDTEITSGDYEWWCRCEIQPKQPLSCLIILPSVWNLMELGGKEKKVGGKWKEKFTIHTTWIC